MNSTITKRDIAACERGEKRLRDLTDTGRSVHGRTAGFIARHYVDSLKAFREEGEGRFPTLETLLADLATRCSVRERFARIAATHGASRLEPRWDLLTTLAREEIRFLLSGPLGAELAAKLKRVRLAQGLQLA